VFALKIEPPSGIFLKSPKIDRIMPKSGGQSAKRRSNIVVTNAWRFDATSRPIRRTCSRGRALSFRFFRPPAGLWFQMLSRSARFSLRMKDYCIFS